MSFANLSRHVLSQLKPNQQLRLTDDATVFIDKLLGLIIVQVQSIMEYQGLINRITQILPPELAKHAIHEITVKHRDIYQNPIGNITQRLNSAVELSKAVLYEYLIAELLELSSNVALDNATNDIDEYHITTAIRNDPELLQLFGSVIPRFPYGYNVSVEGIINRDLTSGFILATNDYISAVTASLSSASIEQITSVIQKFSSVPRRYLNTSHALYSLSIVIAEYIRDSASVVARVGVPLSYSDLITILSDIR